MVTDENALTYYELAAQCVFGTAAAPGACSQTCTLQRTFNSCETGQ